MVIVLGMSYSAASTISQLTLDSRWESAIDDRELQKGQ
jgi:hypothetical protein